MPRLWAIRFTAIALVVAAAVAFSFSLKGDRGEKDTADVPRGEAPLRRRPGVLTSVETWAYQIQKQHEGDAMDRLIASRYELVVIDNVRTVRDADGACCASYDQAGDVRRLKESGKIVIAYIDIGEAEDYRMYWRSGWRPGNPSWIIGPDPDGWEGNYPVAFWHPEWKDILFGTPKSYLDQILDDGFDGIYMDWIEAAMFDPVVEEAKRQERGVEEEMIALIREMREYAHARRPGFFLIAQNAVELGRYPQYLDLIDAIAQEQIWFDGEADPDGMPGDVPMPALTVGEECEPVCSTAYYLQRLEPFVAAGMPVFTVDYATEPENVEKAYAEARTHGFRPYVTTRQLDRLTETPPFVTGQR